MAKSKRRKLTDKLDDICRKIICLRDEDKCKCCEKYARGKDAHCSHVIPRSKGNYLRWDLLNMKLLCFHCHINFWHKNPVCAAEWFKLAFPARWAYLEPLKNKTRKFTIEDLEQLYAELKQKHKELFNEPAKRSVN